MSLTFGSYQWVPYPFNSNATRTFAGLSIGPAASDRWVIAALAINNNTSRSLSAVTIGGVAATLLYAAPTLSADGVRFEFWKANVPTGTTADVDATANTGFFWDGGCATYYCTGEPTFHAGQHDDTYTGNTFSVAINVPANGAVIASASNDGAGTLSGWVGVAADSTDNTEQVYYASADELSAETGRTVSFTTTAASSSTDFYGLGVVSVAVPAGSSDQSLSTTRFVDPDSFGTAVVTRGAVSLAATRYADGDQFGAAIVSRGAVTLTLTRYADADSFGAASVSPGSVSLVAARFVDADGFGAAALATGPVTLAASLFADGDSFGAALAAPGAISLTAALYENADGFGAAVVSQGSGTQTLVAASYVDPNAFGGATVAPGAVTLGATMHSDGDAFGSPVVSRGAWMVGPTLLANDSSFGAAIVVPVSVALSAAIYPDPDQFGVPLVSEGASYRRAALPRDSRTGGVLGSEKNGGRLIRPVNGGILVEG